MDAEIVLFLRECVSESRLQEVLADTFGISSEDRDAPLVVRYAQGFAIGVSIPCNEALEVEHAANTLSERLGTSVLLEACDGAQWLLFAPGASHPFEVEVVELQHGLDVVIPSVNVPVAGAVYA